jgi:hypothetical protein
MVFWCHGLLEEFAWAAPDTRIHCYSMLVLTRPIRPSWCFRVTVFSRFSCCYPSLAKIMAKKAGEIAPHGILARIHFNLQVAVCPAKIWSVLCCGAIEITPDAISIAPVPTITI